MSRSFHHNSATPNSSKLARLHVWIPNLFEFKGGIQVYSAYLLDALQALYPDVAIDVFIKLDRQYPPESSPPTNTRFHFAGKAPTRLKIPFFVAQLLKGGLSQRPDLIITTHFNFTQVAYWLKRLTGTPYWAIAHGIEAWDITNPSLQRALRHADRILAVSNYTRDRLLKEQNLDPAKVRLLPNTFDVDRFQIRPKPVHLLERYHLKPDQPVILTVARLADADRYKGYDPILKALPQIRQAIPDVHYLLVGKGKDRDRIEQLIQELNLEECVTLAGFVPDEQLCDHYNLCDVFAMPSKREGFGIVYLEATACGKPALGGNQDGAIDALAGGKFGALVDPDHVDAIAQTLIQILNKTYPNPLMYQPKALRQAVIDRYGFNEFQRKLAQHIDDRF